MIFKKRIIKFSFILLTIAVIASPLIVASIIVSKKTKNKKNNDINNDGIGSNINDGVSDKDISQNILPNRVNIADDEVSSIGTNVSSVIKEENRKIQTNYYESECWVKYHDDYGFVYPSQTHNYRVNNNNIFKNSAGKTIDGYDVVMNERVDFNGQKVKYSDANWIKNEIKTGNFKKHRAADDMFLNKYDNVKSVTKKYTISTATLGDLALGLFAPAGEVIEVTFSDSTWEILKNNLGAIQFVINQNMWDNKDKSDFNGKISNRYPFIETSFSINSNEKTLKFGSCFGGGISLFVNNRLTKSNNSFPLDNQILDISFIIKGAIPCLFYQYGQTSEKEWFDQIEKVQNDNLAPWLQATSAYFSLAIPFTGKNEVGHKAVSSLVYPKELFKKWSDFLYLSNYFAGRDLSNELKRLNMEYCDDIWGGAGVAAWGGGMSFYCPTEWGINSMFYESPLKVFNPANSWGVFHEINHNFEQNNAFFSKRSHGETNIVNMFDLSVIGDSSRNRSELNWQGTPTNENNGYFWSWLTTPFSILSQLPWRFANNAINDLEYPLYGLLLYWMGSKNFADYVRKDAREHPSSASDWTGLKEIERICDTFKLNIWPSFEYFGKWWRDKWPESYSLATTEEKKIIDRLNQSYKTVDFVACQYATGQYLWNQDTKKWDYTGDTTLPFQIPAYYNYTLKLDEMIVSLNPDFVWNDVQFDAKTKLGATIKKDPNNPKNLIYIPNKNKLDQIDEFNISIIPGNWKNKPSNYIDKYIFKIKIRQVINQPILETFNVMDIITNSSNDMDRAFEVLNNYDDPNYRLTMGYFDNFNLYFQDNKKRGIKIKFKFVAQESGKYTFSNKWDDLIRMYVNSKKVFSRNSWIGKFVDTYEVNLNKGDVLDFEYQIINTGGNGNFEMQVKLNDQIIDPFMNNNLMSPNLSNDKKDLLNQKKYQFQQRLINREIFKESLTSSVNFSDTSILKTIDKNDYYITSPESNRADELMGYGNNNWLEIWKDEWFFDVNFNKPTLISSLCFGHRTNNWWDMRPHTIKVSGVDQNNKEVVLYDGEYGVQFNDRSNDYSILNLTNPAIVKSLKIEMTNKKRPGHDGGCIIIASFKASSNKYIQYGSSYAFNNPYIKVSEGWIFYSNNSNNESALNNLYCVSRNKNDTIEFTLNNSNGFSLIGQGNNSNAQMDIYINDQKFTIFINELDTIYNHSIFKYVIDNETNLKVKIVNKSSKPIYLNYFMTFGKNSSVA